MKKTIIFGMLMILLLSLVSARDYTIERYSIEADKTSNPKITYYSDKLGENITHYLESESTYGNESYPSYGDYIQYKMDENEMMIFNHTQWMETYETKEIIIINNQEEIIGKGFVWDFIKKIINWIIVIEDRTQYLEDELCKKDNTYGFCN